MKPFQHYMNIGRKWVEKRIMNNTLKHHGVKGQKWGVRNGPPYPLKNATESDRITITGHSSPARNGKPNSTVDHIGKNGKIKTRAFYDEDGWKAAEIHTNDHNNPKQHPYGFHGEHYHRYTWDKETDRLINKTCDEIPGDVREENQDIL